ncbi:SigE family RNA polymerase sigma factor [Motilibacter aurantiacus]|uniref:SigE family RNA polymerase sigma factor n=1 Tax=Motilibacter aurantiacus TaxID=2714955 RepID=UPI00140E4640|nr:SigE family RNA polymerase sigma factor [Motilibacter aurantiacus]NHC43764.1 SigE family RNA polymerase sigma factor [Motilibacter aurantiacus]
MKEPEGFRGFVESRYAALVRFGTLLCGDPGRGEDTVQDALLKTLQAWDRLDLHGEGGNGAEAYTRTVMTHAVWRSARRRWWGERPTAELPELADADAYAAADTADAVRRALAALPAQQRVVLVLRYWGQLSEAEIADQLNCSVGTVKSRASRAMASLRASGMLDESLEGGAR